MKKNGIFEIKGVEVREEDAYALKDVSPDTLEIKIIKEKGLLGFMIGLSFGLGLDNHERTY